LSVFCPVLCFVAGPDSYIVCIVSCPVSSCLLYGFDSYILYCALFFVFCTVWFRLLYIHSVFCPALRLVYGSNSYLLYCVLTRVLCMVLPLILLCCSLSCVLYMVLTLVSSLMFPVLCLVYGFCLLYLLYCVLSCVFCTVHPLISL
jgi:hypothetical protein